MGNLRFWIYDLRGRIDSMFLWWVGGGGEDWFGTVWKPSLPDRGRFAETSYRAEGEVFNRMERAGGKC